MFRIRHILAIVVTLCAAGALCWYVFARPVSRHFDVDRAVYPVKGIDLSAHNGAVDFDSVAADSVTFVYLKATEGIDFCDSRFDVNFRAARAAGLKVGAYHYFRFNTDGARQAEHFMTTIGDRNPDLPLAIDVEAWGNTASVDDNAVVSELAAMIEMLEHKGWRVMIYTNKNGYRRFVEDKFTTVDLWICSLSGVPDPDLPWNFWQHSHKGHVRGITGDVDLNTVRQ